MPIVPTRLMEAGQQRQPERFSFRTPSITLSNSANKVSSVLDASRPLILRDLRERAQRPAAIDLAVGRMRRQDGGRRLAVLAPSLERRQRVEDVWTFAAAAVRHP